MKKILTFLVLASAALLCGGCGCGTPKAEAEGDNPIIQNIMARRSIRQYTGDAVPRKLLQKLAECGVNAPNAMNRQAWELRIIDRPDFFPEDIRGALRNAPALIAVACPDDESGMSLINVGLLCENICLAAQSMGLGTVILGGAVRMLPQTPEGRECLSRLAFSDGYSLRIFIGIGYPAESPDPRPRDLGKIMFVD